MASVKKFSSMDPIDLDAEIKRRDEFAESIRRLHFIAARRIQAWIRGILTRNHFRLLHKSATTVQRHWRGYRARIAFDRFLIESVHRMWQNYYNKMATRIQAFWRGYWVRKTVLDIQKMRRWLNEVYAKNAETVENMKRFRQAEIEYVEAVMERESMQWILFILFKLHHLLRTKHRPGVLTRMDSNRFTLFEEMLKCLEYKRYVHWKRKEQKKKCRDCRIDAKPSLVLRGTRYERCEKAIREIEKDLQKGVVPLYRSEPYEKRERSMREANQVRLERFIHEACEAPSTPALETKREQEPKKRCSLRKEFEQQVSRVRESELCEKIEKMDCHLNQLRLRCPIHDPPCAT
ncbi:unnamed protein product [Xylocopa violacea]|uniref:Spermatogenesis-associated protein 17 n=1 Tax=Xylocopa violacea TaxID=135666 RepID=A0ABP1N0H8_XYLVO